MDLRVEEGAPAVDLARRQPEARENEEDPAAQTHDGVGHEADGHDGEQQQRMPAKAEDAEQRDVAVLLGEKRHLGDQQDGAPCHEAELVHQKARELRRAGFAHVHAALGETVDLSGRGADLHGGKVAKEDAAHLDGDEVADADGRVGVEPYGDGVGGDAEEHVEDHAQARDDEPRDLHVAHGAHEVGDLPRDHEVDDIDHEHEADKDGAAASTLVVVTARGGGIDRRRRSGMFGGIRHGAPLQNSRSTDWHVTDNIPSLPYPCELTVPIWHAEKTPKRREGMHTGTMAAMPSSRSASKGSLYTKPRADGAGPVQEFSLGASALNSPKLHTLVPWPGGFAIAA